MLLTALILVFCSAILHVTWNVKLQSENDPLDTTTKALSLGLVCLLPVFFGYWIYNDFLSVSGHAILFAGLSGVAELGYFWFLSYSYRRGELSVVYPLARGSAPVLTFIFGVVFLNEHISQPQVIGVCCLLLGIWLVRSTAISGARGAIPAIVTGVFIAAFMILDKIGLGGTDPILFGGMKYASTVLCLLAFVPFRSLVGMTKSSKMDFHSWKKYLFIGICIISTYQLVLFALTMAPVAIISPLRESASVVVTIWGIWKLRERNKLVPKLIGIASIFAGIILLAL